jgi:meromycolic acid (3R)-3-hydroxyacyl-[acyl-carrier protein] dehydratase HadB
MTRAFEGVAVDDPVPEVRRLVTREDVGAYAEASGDRNPLHLDDVFARSVGFDGVIAHGMFTMGHMSVAVVSWAGDPAAVQSISAQFREPVPMGVEIVAGGRVRSIDPETRTAELDLWVTFERGGATGYPVKRGSARVALS